MQPVALAFALQRRRINAEQPRTGLRRSHTGQRAGNMLKHSIASRVLSPPSLGVAPVPLPGDLLTSAGSPRSAGSTRSRGARMTARSMALRNSRRLPGQGYACMVSSQDGAKANDRRP